jgi:DNA (cytosine-5)-methyltransferase 1
MEAATLAWAPLGWRCAFVSEIEKAPCALLKHHYPDVPNFGDMTKFEGCLSGFYP